VAKAHRQNKIKSKKFHRIQRKEKIKQCLKEFEELQKTNPEAALEKLDQLDKARAEERMTLRHKSTGQWAKNKQVRAKYDKEVNKIILPSSIAYLHFIYNYLTVFVNLFWISRTNISRMSS
jgi:U3 small nucleolar RNA-associated protein 14